MSIRVVMVEIILVEFDYTIFWDELGYQNAAKLAYSLVGCFVSYRMNQHIWLSTFLYGQLLTVKNKKRKNNKKHIKAKASII